MKSLFALLAAVALFTGCAVTGPMASAVKPMPGAQTPQDYTAAVLHTNQLNYLLYVPRDYAADTLTRTPK